MEESYVISCEKNDDYSNDDLFNITSWGADITLRDIIASYNDGDIIKPELQRKYVWDKKEASRFIESILLGLPVPSVFLARAQDNRQLIVDGYQRIKTICDFESGIWSGDSTIFKLTNSERINERWRNKSYKELTSEDQRSFRTYTIHAIIFEQKQPKDDSGLYQIFERINTSGRTLLPQEIRNCVYQGKLNNLLIELNRYDKWRKLFGEEKEHSRMQDLEYILRFFTLSQEAILCSPLNSISLKKELNCYMQNNKEIDDTKYDTLKNRFEKCIDFIYANFGENAFYNLQNDLRVVRKKFYPTVYDSIMISTEIAMSKGFVPDSDLEDKRLNLLRDFDYRNSITQGTMKIESIKTRVDRALSSIFNMSRDE